MNGRVHPFAYVLFHFIYLYMAPPPPPQRSRPQDDVLLIRAAVGTVYASCTHRLHSYVHASYNPIPARRANHEEILSWKEGIPRSRFTVSGNHRMYNICQ